LLTELLPRATLRIALRAGAAEEALENRSWPNLGRHRRIRRPPRNAVAVCAAITVVAVPALYTLLAAQLNRREPRLACQLLRRHLIHRDAGLDILTVRFLRMDAREIRRSRPAVIARA